MKDIIFVTGNSGKAEALRSQISSEKYNVIQLKIDLTEPQANTAVEVSISKAKQAFDILKKPLVVDDSAFHIDALNGFPGVYIKYTLETIGLNGILKLMKGVENRKCNFEGALTYIESPDFIQTFAENTDFGTIANEIDNSESSKAWGDTWKIFIPEGLNRTLSSMSPEELIEHNKTKTSVSVFKQFSNWLEKRDK